MKKILFVMIISMKVSFSICQDLNLNLKSHITVNDTQSIQLFERIDGNGPRECYDQKTASIINGRKLSPCFKLLKTLTIADSKKLVNVLRSRDTYEVEKYDCFTTDYAMILFDKNKAVIGYASFSFTCNRLYSSPNIDELKSVLPKAEYLVGFSKKGRKKILQILGLSEHMLFKHKF